MAGQLGSSERERLLDEIVGQLGHNAGGLDKISPLHEQIRDAPLQPLDAGGSAHRRRRASLQNPWAGGGLQRRGGSTVGPGRIGAEAVGPRSGIGLSSNIATNTRFVRTGVGQGLITLHHPQLAAMRAHGPFLPYSGSPTRGTATASV